MGSKKYYIIKYADDMYLVAETAKGLKQMLKELEKYTDGNDLVVNASKTKIMIVKAGCREVEEQEWSFKGEKLEVVSEFKYLGYWCTVSSSFKKHTKWLVSKTQQAMNATWGLIKRAGRATLKERLHLYNSLANSGALYGVEVWGWAFNEDYNRLYARAHKMALGVAKNTPEYIWRLEAGVESSLFMTRKRASRYLVDILRMEDSRWPKLCLREEVRNIMNGKPSKWGKAVVHTLELMECEDVLELIWRRHDPDGVQQRLEVGFGVLQVLEEKKTKEMVFKSTYCPLYKFIKTSEGCDDYWKDKTGESWTKEVWSRLRCGSVDRCFKKGYKDWTCRICNSQQETLAHLLTCREARNLCSEKTMQVIQSLTENKYEADLDFLVKELLRGPPVREVCSLIAAIEKAGKREE